MLDSLGDSLDDLGWFLCLFNAREFFHCIIFAVHLPITGLPWCHPCPKLQFVNLVCSMHYAYSSVVFVCPTECIFLFLYIVCF